MASTEAGQGGVVRELIGGHDPKADILDEAPFDPSARSFAHAVGVDQNRQHHPRVIDRAASAVLPMPGIEPGQIELGHDIENEPRQMPVRKPLAHRRRHQEQLLPVKRPNVDRHAPSSPAPQNAGGMVNIHATASDVLLCSRAGEI